jgi:hypothetical protein
MAIEPRRRRRLIALAAAVGILLGATAAYEVIYVDHVPIVSVEGHGKDRRDERHKRRHDPEKLKEKEHKKEERSKRWGIFCGHFAGAAGSWFSGGVFGFGSILGSIFGSLWGVVAMFGTACEVLFFVVVAGVLALFCLAAYHVARWVFGMFGSREEPEES